VGVSVVRIYGRKAKRYIAMNARGEVYTTVSILDAYIPGNL